MPDDLTHAELMAELKAEIAAAREAADRAARAAAPARRAGQLHLHRWVMISQLQS
ncbi:hypothetical protein OA2633_00280 [Oceanicaulis sp. HTCC2633]|nr:hypothetical protein OA2633_00280 [Oceanicaulis sp. HTCC2633]